MDLEERRKQILENNKKYIENKEFKKIEKKKGYYDKNKWKYKRYYKNNRENLIEYQKEYYRLNKQKIKNDAIIYDNE